MLDTSIPEGQEVWELINMSSRESTGIFTMHMRRLEFILMRDGVVYTRGKETMGGDMIWTRGVFTTDMRNY